MRISWRKSLCSNSSSCLSCLGFLRYRGPTWYRIRSKSFRQNHLRSFSEIQPCRWSIRILPGLLLSIWFYLRTLTSLDCLPWLRKRPRIRPGLCLFRSIIPVVCGTWEYRLNNWGLFSKHFWLLDIVSDHRFCLHLSSTRKLYIIELKVWKVTYCEGS